MKTYLALRTLVIDQKKINAGALFTTELPHDLEADLIKNRRIKFITVAETVTKQKKTKN